MSYPWQCGPVVNVHVPKDKLTQQHMGFGFVEFKSEEDAQYAIKVTSQLFQLFPDQNSSELFPLQVLNMIKIFGKPIRVNAVRACVLLHAYRCFTLIASTRVALLRLVCRRQRTKKPSTWAPTSS